MAVKDTDTPPEAAGAPKDVAPDSTSSRSEIERGAVATALAAAKERSSRGESIVPAEAATDAATEPTEEGSQAPKSKVEETAAEPGPGEGEGESGGGKESGEPAGDPKAKDEPAPKGADAGDDDEFVTVELPSRTKDGEPVKVEVPKELAEDINRLRNGYMRGEEFRAEREKVHRQREEVAADREEITYIDTELRADPAGFILRHVNDPAIRADILLELLTDERVWKNEKLVEQIRGLQDDEGTRDVVRTRVERDRLKAERERGVEREQIRSIREGVRETGSIIRSFIPDELEQDRANKFYRVALTSMAELGGHHGKTKFTRDEIVSHLDRQGFLEAFGIDPQAARKDAPTNGATSPGKAKATDDGGAPARVRKPTAEDARKTQENLKQRGDKDRSARAWAPEGSAPPAAAVELPKEGVIARIKRVRAHGSAALMGQG